MTDETVHKLIEPFFVAIVVIVILVIVGVGLLIVSPEKKGKRADPKDPNTVTVGGPENMLGPRKNPDLSDPKNK